MNSVTVLNNVLRSATGSCLTAPANILLQQTRNVFILKRRNPAPSFRKGAPYPRLSRRHRIYDCVANTDLIKKPPINIILTKFVDGIGNKGDIISLSPMKAYNNFLLLGLGVYASPENLKKFNMDKTKIIVEKKSCFIDRTLEHLSKSLLNVVMSAENPWTLEKWHIRSSFRKMGVHVNDDCITMPERPISGPNKEIENKEFYVTVTVNKESDVIVRCRIHHWSNNPNDSMPSVRQFYLKPSEPIYPEDKSVLESLPLPHAMNKEMNKTKEASESQ